MSKKLPEFNFSHPTRSHLVRGNGHLKHMLTNREGLLKEKEVDLIDEITQRLDKLHHKIEKRMRKPKPKHIKAA